MDSDKMFTMLNIDYVFDIMCQDRTFIRFLSCILLAASDNEEIPPKRYVKSSLKKNRDSIVSSKLYKSFDFHN